MSLWKKVKASFQKWDGKSVDVDWHYANMCVDWVRQYALDIGYPITTYGNARGFATIWLWPNWKPTNNPQIGDIFVQPRDTYWHIWTVEEVENGILHAIEQNRDWQAYKNNNPNNLGSPVGRGKYQIRGDEVYFTPNIPPVRGSTNIKMRPGYKWDDPKYQILNQEKSNDCVGFAILNCLMRMRDMTEKEVNDIAKALISEKWNEVSIRAGAEWFKKRGLIKGYRVASYSKPLLKRQPLIMRVSNANWVETGKSGKLTYGGRDTVGAHWVCVATTGKAVNQYTKNWWDNWYFRFTDEQADNIALFYTLII